jgi:indolepyruvate ferredoxin oxidoreductase
VLGYAWQKGWLPLSLARSSAIELNAVRSRRTAPHSTGAAARRPASVKQAAAGAAGAAQRATVIALHTKKALDALIAKRVEFLTAYQNAAYAARYAAFVDKVRAPNARLPTATPRRSR